MRNLRLCVCLLVSGTLFILGGCEKAHVKPSKVAGVTINNCAAAPDPVTVYEGDQIDWQAGDNRDYTIAFRDHNEPTPNPFPVKHGVTNPPHLIKGYSGCDHGEHGDFYCNYTVTSNSAPCTKDPVVHIIPGSG